MLNFTFAFVFIYFDVCLVIVFVTSGKFDVYNTYQKNINRTKQKSLVVKRNDIRIEFCKFMSQLK